METISREMVKDHEKLVVGYDRYGRFVPTELRRGVSQEANYRISLEVSAHNQNIHGQGSYLRIEILVLSYRLALQAHQEAE